MNVDIYKIKLVPINYDNERIQQKCREISEYVSEQIEDWVLGCVERLLQHQDVDMDKLDLVNKPDLGIIYLYYDEEEIDLFFYQDKVDTICRYRFPRFEYNATKEEDQ